MVVAGELTGKLSETLLKVGEIFEAKTDDAAKNLTVILEPLLLVVVWLGVVGVALAVILPIYSVIGGLSDVTGGVSGGQSVEVSVPVRTVSREIEILETDTGYLNAYLEPDLDSEILLEIKSGNIFNVLGDQDGWYNIEIPEVSEGWIQSQYVRVLVSGQ